MITVKKLVLAASALLLASIALAQEPDRQDDVLQRYALAVENLDAAVGGLPDDAAAARSSLDQAFSALLTLSRGGNATLSQSIDRVFERARTAIDNRSVTDLAVQAEVLRGGFQRLLYEAALTSAVEGQPERARTRLLRLAEDVDLGEARIDRLEDATGAGALRRVFEAGVAEQVSARLDRLVQEGAPLDRDADYRAFADAYADYLLIQDSPRLQGDTNRRFIEAANAIVDEEDDAFAEAVASLRDDLASLREAADAEADAAERGEAPADEEPVLQDPEQDPGAADADEADAAELPPVDEDVAEAEAEAEAADDAAEAGEPEEVDEEAAATEADLRERIEAEREAEELAALEEDVAAFGVQGDDRERLARLLHDAGMRGVADAEAELAALGSRFAAHVLRGEREEARIRLRELRAAYEATLAALVTGAAPDADRSLRSLLSRLQDASALRSEDAALLNSELQALGEAIRGAPAAESHVWLDRTASWWSGPVRPVVMIVLAILALVPLRLLDLAFGGGNRNWRLVGAALFLLLVPVLYEGVAGAAALLAGPLGLPALATLTTWSVFQNDLTQMVWAVLVLLALILAIVGFYGICVQFGVLGRRAAPAPSAATSEPPTGDETLVDWDDEF